VIRLAVILSLTAALPGLQAQFRQTRPAVSPPAAERDGAAVLSGVRLAFEPNMGQADRRVDFSVRAGAATVYFTDHGVTNVLDRPNGSSAWVVEQRFVGTRGVEPTGLRRAPGIVSYFRGSPGEWITSIATYRAIAYRDV
jgi:hypothetical protein